MRAGEIVGYGARDGGIAKQSGKSVGATVRAPLKFAEDHLAVVDVVNHTGFEPVQADKTKPAQNLVRRRTERASCSSLPSPFCKVKMAVAGPTNGGSSRGNCSLAVVLSPISTSSHGPISSGLLAHRGRVWKSPCGLRTMYAVAADNFVIRTQQKMDFVPGAGELGAVKAPDCPAANNSDFHGNQDVERLMCQGLRRHVPCSANPLSNKKGTLRTSECLNRKV